jgi:cellulose biosynthesis protein BcsQ
MLGHDPIESLQDSIRQHTINYHYIPAHPMMGKFDTVFENLGRDENGVFTDAVIRNSVLWNILEQIKELPAPAGRRTPYDLVIIDTNPHLGNLTNNALMGCSDLLIPVSSELYPLFGVVQVHTQVGAIIRQGAQIRTKSILLTMTQNTNVSVGAEGEMKRKNGKAVLKTTIPRRVDVQEAALRRAPIVETHPNNPAALAYVEAAKELWGKIKRN